MITTVSPKPMIAIVLRPRRIVRMLVPISNWPWVRMLKYAPIMRTASVTPPRRASVVQARRNRPPRSEGPKTAAMVCAMFVIVDAGGGGRCCAAPSRARASSLLRRQARQRVRLDVRELRLPGCQVRLGDHRQALGVREDFPVLQELGAGD